MEHRIRIRDTALDPAELDRSVSTPQNGGRVIFIGAVREENFGKAVSGIRYEAYEPMALKVIATIADEAVERFGVQSIAIDHRVGDLLIGDLAVVIAVGSPHRSEAFDACQYLIDELKHRAPIWKKESYEDGDAWVSCTP